MISCSPQNHCPPTRIIPNLPLTFSHLGFTASPYKTSSVAGTIGGLISPHKIFLWIHSVQHPIVVKWMGIAYLYSSSLLYLQSNCGTQKRALKQGLVCSTLLLLYISNLQSLQWQCSSSSSTLLRLGHYATIVKLKTPANFHSSTSVLPQSYCGTQYSALNQGPVCSFSLSSCKPNLQSLQWRSSSSTLHPHCCQDPPHTTTPGTSEQLLSNSRAPPSFSSNSPTSTNSSFPSGLTNNKWMHIYAGNIPWRNVKGLNIASWNCGGGFLTKGKLLETELFLKEHNIDLMAISEVEITRTTFHRDELYSIKGYSCIFPPSWIKIGKTRILLYVKDTIKQHISQRTDLSPASQPVIWVQVNTSPTFLVSFIYREWTSLGDKSSQGQQARWINFLKKVKRAVKHEVIILGDFNIRAEDINKDGNLTTPLYNLMLEEGMDQIIESPTRERLVDGILQQSTIDLIITSKKENIVMTDIKKTSSSDHSIISLKRKINKSFEPEKITIRNMRHFSPEKFNQDLQQMKWEFNDGDVDDAVDLFNKNVLTCLDSNAPWITFIPKHKSNPLISKETIELIKTREKAFTKAKKTKSPEDIAAWKTLRNRAVGSIRKDKTKADLLNFANPRTAWIVFNNLRKKNNKSQNAFPEKIIINDKEITDKRTMAEEFNKFFTSKVTKLKEKVGNKATTIDPVEHLLKLIPNDLPSLSLRPIKVDEVTETIDKAKNSKSSGPDGISNYFLKLASTSIANPLTTIFNQSITSGKFPSLWKEAAILPLHKKNSKHDINNYRNINLVSKVGLILEKLVHKQISDHFTQFNLFSKSQNAYIKGRSTSTLSAALYDRCCRAAHIGKFAGILSVDLKAGFDLIDGEILANKFQQGFKTNQTTTAWLKSYMSNRTQSVLVGKERSERVPSASALGQGTNLAPLLFNIATTDLPNATIHGEMDLFADDLNDTVVDKDPNVVVEKLQEDANKIVDWLHSNKLCLADGKSTLLLATNKEKHRDDQTENLTITLDGDTIKQSPHIKVLGCIFSKNLSWSEHLHGPKDDPSEKGLIRSLSNILGVVSSMQNCPAISAHMFLNATFNSKLIYGMETWGAVPDSLIKQLQSLQNRAAKIIMKSSFLPVSQKLQKLGWLPVKDLITRSSLTLLHKMKTLSTSPYFDQFISHSRSNYWDCIPTYNPEQRGLLNKSFLPRTIKSWNSLPEDVRRLPPATFKRAVSNLLRAQKIH